jgi:hypothetical protein
LLSKEKSYDLAEKRTQIATLTSPKLPGTYFLKGVAQSPTEKAFFQTTLELEDPFRAQLEVCQQGKAGAPCNYQITLSGGTPPFYGALRGPGIRVKFPLSERLQNSGSFLLPEEPGELVVKLEMFDEDETLLKKRASILVRPPPPKATPVPTSKAPQSPPSGRKNPRLKRCQELDHQRLKQEQNQTLGRRESLTDLSIDFEKLTQNSLDEWLELGCIDLLEKSSEGEKEP